MPFALWAHKKTWSCRSGLSNDPIHRLSRFSGWIDHIGWRYNAAKYNDIFVRRDEDERGTKVLLVEDRPSQGPSSWERVSKFWVEVRLLATMSLVELKKFSEWLSCLMLVIFQCFWALKSNFTSVESLLLSRRLVPAHLWWLLYLSRHLVVY